MMTQGISAFYVDNAQVDVGDAVNIGNAEVMVVNNPVAADTIVSMTMLFQKNYGSGNVLLRLKVHSNSFLYEKTRQTITYYVNLGKGDFCDNFVTAKT